MTRDEREMLYLTAELVYVISKGVEGVFNMYGVKESTLRKYSDQLEVCLTRHRNVIERDREALEKQAKEIASLSRQENANEANIWMGKETQA